jgi:hypothetical protein
MTAAKRIDAAMVRAMGTDTPTLSEVKRLVLSQGVRLEPVYGNREFTADLIPAGDGTFTIRHNAHELPITQKVRIYHELCEVMAIKSHPGLFDDDPDVSVFAFDGGHSPQDMRHLAALECERAMIQRLNAAGYTVPRSVSASLRERTPPRRTRTHQSGLCHCGCGNSRHISFEATP